MAKKSKEKNQLAITSLIVGLISLILGWIPFYGWFFVITAIVTGFMALNKLKKNKKLNGKRMAIAGIILGFVMVGIKLLVLLLVAGGIFGFLVFSPVEEREVMQSVPAELGIDPVNLTIAFGAGDLDFKAGSNDTFLNSKLITTDVNDPILESTNEEISIERTSKGSCFFCGKQKYEWFLEISPDVEYDVALKYGAAEVDIDLNGLKVNTLTMEMGASDNEIIFGNYPTKAEIKTGVSSMDLKFPEGAGVIITIDGGLLGIDFDRFTKQNDTYYSEGYNEVGDNIEISIEAGASSIDSDFY